MYFTSPMASIKVGSTEQHQEVALAAHRDWPTYIRWFQLLSINAHNKGNQLTGDSHLPGIHGDRLEIRLFTKIITLTITYKV